jgi:hypothetical protein
VIAAIRTAKDQFGPPPANPTRAGLPSRRRHRALVSIAMSMACWMWPAASSTRAPEDRSGEDRTLVVVQVSVENLAGNVPAGTPAPAEVDGSVSAETSTTPERDGNVLAVTPAAAVCHIAGVGSVEPARRNGMPATVRCLAR